VQHINKINRWVDKMDTNKLKAIVLLVMLVCMAVPVLAQETSKSAPESAILGSLMKEVKDIKRIVVTEIKQSNDEIKKHTTQEVDKLRQDMQAQIDKLRSALMVQLGIGVTIGLIIGWVIIQLIFIRLRTMRVAIKKRELEGMVKPFEERKMKLEEELEILTKKLEKVKQELKDVIAKKREKEQGIPQKDAKLLKKLADKYGLRIASLDTGHPSPPPNWDKIEQIIAKGELPDLPESGLKPPARVKEPKKMIPIWIWIALGLGTLLIIFSIIVKVMLK